jgi:hypothetical protein
MKDKEINAIPAMNGKSPEPGVPDTNNPYLKAPKQNVMPIPIQNRLLTKSRHFIVVQTPRVPDSSQEVAPVSIAVAKFPGALFILLVSASFKPTERFRGEPAFRSPAFGGIYPCLRARVAARHAGMAVHEAARFCERIDYFFSGNSEKPNLGNIVLFSSYISINSL